MRTGLRWRPAVRRWRWRPSARRRTARRRAEPRSGRPRCQTAQADPRADEGERDPRAGRADHVAQTRRLVGDLRHRPARQTGADVARRPLPRRQQHEDDDVDGDPAARAGGQAQTRRPDLEVPPRRPQRRRHHDRAAVRDAQRAVQLHLRRRLQRDARRAAAQGVDARRAAADRLQPPARLRARRAVRVQQHQHRAARARDRAADENVGLGGLSEADLRPARDDPQLPARAHRLAAAEAASARLPVRHQRRDDRLLRGPQSAAAGRPRRQAEAARRHERQPRGRGRPAARSRPPATSPATSERSSAAGC